MTDEERPKRGNVIAGRYGSPTFTLALPFAKITNVDSELRDVVIDLAALVARIAEHAATADAPELDVLRGAAEELVARLALQSR